MPRVSGRVRPEVRSHWSFAEAGARGWPVNLVWRRHRVACRVSLATLAAAAGTSAGSVSRWERGAMPDPRRARAYLDALDRCEALGRLADAEADRGARLGVGRRGRPVGG